MRSKAPTNYSDLHLRGQHLLLTNVEKNAAQADRARPATSLLSVSDDLAPSRAAYRSQVASFEPAAAIPQADFKHMWTPDGYGGNPLLISLKRMMDAQGNPYFDFHLAETTEMTKRSDENVVLSATNKQKSVDGQPATTTFTTTIEKLPSRYNKFQKTPNAMSGNRFYTITVDVVDGTEQRLKAAALYTSTQQAAADRPAADVLISAEQLRKFIAWRSTLRDFVDFGAVKRFSPPAHELVLKQTAPVASYLQSAQLGPRMSQALETLTLPCGGRDVPLVTHESLRTVMERLKSTHGSCRLYSISGAGTQALAADMHLLPTIQLTADGDTDCARTSSARRGVSPQVRHGQILTTIGARDVLPPNSFYPVDHPTQSGSKLGGTFEGCERMGMMFNNNQMLGVISGDDEAKWMIKPTATSCAAYSPEVSHLSERLARRVISTDNASQCPVVTVQAFCGSVCIAPGANPIAERSETLRIMDVSHGMDDSKVNSFEDTSFMEHGSNRAQSFMGFPQALCDYLKEKGHTLRAGDGIMLTDFDSTRIFIEGNYASTMRTGDTALGPRLVVGIYHAYLNKCYPGSCTSAAAPYLFINNNNEIFIRSPRKPVTGKSLVGIHKMDELSPKAMQFAMPTTTRSEATIDSDVWDQPLKVSKNVEASINLTAVLFLESDQEHPRGMQPIFSRANILNVYSYWKLSRVHRIKLLVEMVEFMAALNESELDEIWSLPGHRARGNVGLDEYGVRRAAVINAECWFKNFSGQLLTKQTLNRKTQHNVLTSAIDAPELFKVLDVSHINGRTSDNYLWISSIRKESWKINQLGRNYDVPETSAYTMSKSTGPGPFAHRRDGATPIPILFIHDFIARAKRLPTFDDLSALGRIMNLNTHNDAAHLLPYDAHTKCCVRAIQALQQQPSSEDEDDDVIIISDDEKQKQQKQRAADFVNRVTPESHYFVADTLTLVRAQERRAGGDLDVYVGQMLSAVDAASRHAAADNIRAHLRQRGRTVSKRGRTTDQCEDDQSAREWSLVNGRNRGRQPNK